MTRRSYGQNCALAHALDVVGDRWTVLIIRELLIGPCRYKELAEALAGIGTNLLAQRLKQLQSDGLIVKSVDAPGRYRLTPRGQSLEPVVLGLIRWGLQLGDRRQDDYQHQDRWDVLALKALFDPTHRGRRISACFLKGAAPLWVSVDGGEFNYLFEELPADLVLNCSLGELYVDVTQGRSPAERLVSGDAKTLNDFLAYFLKQGD